MLRGQMSGRQTTRKRPFFVRASFFCSVALLVGSDDQRSSKAIRQMVWWHRLVASKKWRVRTHNRRFFTDVPRQINGNGLLLCRYFILCLSSSSTTGQKPVSFSRRKLGLPRVSLCFFFLLIKKVVNEISLLHYRKSSCRRSCCLCF